MLPSAPGSAPAPALAAASGHLACNLGLQLIRRRSDTLLLRVSGESMRDAGISHGDLLIIDRGLEPRPGQIVVACLDGGFTLKRLVEHRGRLRLEAAHPDYPPLELNGRGEAQIWGVALHVIHTPQRH